MSVPKITQLKPGTGVNIVLKADQRTGKLTTGQISDVLTRGDHPRGIKVRLRDGRIGRVQSLSSVSSGTGSDNAHSHASAATTTAVPDGSLSGEETGGGSGGRGGRRQKYKLQEDYRGDPSPSSTTSLADYIKPARKFPTSRSTTSVQTTTAQAQLESEFPNLDSALVAAILTDHASAADARNVLQALS